MVSNLSSGPTLCAPKSLRLHIGVFGRRNVGKSSLINTLTRQQTSIVSAEPGTTTDPVDKAMELLPLGPVVLIDTAGIDDEQPVLGELRVGRTKQAMERTELALLVFEAGCWGEHESRLAEELSQRQIPFVLVANKLDRHAGEEIWLGVPGEWRQEGRAVALSLGRDESDQSGEDSAKERERSAEDLRQAIIAAVPASFLEERPILSDLIPVHGTAVLVVPIDKEAPKGRLIMPQVQTIRDLLDAQATSIVTQVERLPQVLTSLKDYPDIVVTDSQAFKRVADIVPPQVPLTSFSVLFSRFKGDLSLQLAGARHLLRLDGTARILIAEACAHHPIAEDIGTVKIPRLLAKTLGSGITVEHCQGRDFPENLSSYDLVIHCGGCTLNRRAMLRRLQMCRSHGVAVTNYGLAIAAMNGILERSVAVMERSKP